tara:strand:- start:71 stop:1000 length:930 start_codon:yes stop_codon:yes gene_type:complete
MLFSCKSNSDLKEVEFFFSPSFLYPTKFNIDIKNSTIEQYTFQDSYYVKEWIDSTSYREHRKDTLVVHYKKTFKIDKSELNRFLTELKLSRLDSTVEHRRSVLDGIGFRVSKINSRNDTISLTSISPSRTEEFQMDYKLLDAFFDLSYKSIDDYDGISGIENIQDYFNYGLPLRKVNENPIEYRVWGSISGCRDDNQEFLRILESLPNDKPVIFDLRNGSIAYCLNEVLEEYSQKKELYIYGDNSALQSKKIMDEIKLAEKNGEVLSELRIQAYETHKMIYENWKNNQKIKSFLTKEEIIKTIANNGYK